VNENARVKAAPQARVDGVMRALFAGRELEPTPAHLIELVEELTRPSWIEPQARWAKV